LPCSARRKKTAPTHSKNEKGKDRPRQRAARRIKEKTVVARVRGGRKKEKSSLGDPESLLLSLSFFFFSHGDYISAAKPSKHSAEAQSTCSVNKRPEIRDSWALLHGEGGRVSAGVGVELVKLNTVHCEQAPPCRGPGHARAFPLSWGGRVSVCVS
jgi:hypothetical protein